MSSRRKKVVLSGYYGFNNCGDEGVLLAILQALRTLKPELDIIVLSGNPSQTASDFGVRAVSRRNLLQIGQSLLGAKLLISGGGSLLQDVTSAKSPLYYLGIIALAQRLAKKTMIYAQGIGPLQLNKNRQKTVKILNKCDLITLRDQGSANELATMGLTRSMTVVADPVLGLQLSKSEAQIGGDLLCELGILNEGHRKSRPLLIVTLRTWKNNDFFDKIATVLDQRVNEGWDVLFIPMHFPQDMQAITCTVNHMKQRSYCLGQQVSPKVFFSLIQQANQVLAMRLHGLIFAMAAGVPMVALAYDPKVQAFMSQTGLDTCIAVEEFESGELLAAFRRLSDRSLRLTEHLEDRRKHLYNKAWEAAHLAVELLDS